MTFAGQPTARVARTRIVLRTARAFGFWLAASAAAGCSEPTPASTTSVPGTVPSTMASSTGVIDGAGSLDAGLPRADAGSGSLAELDAGVMGGDAAPSGPAVPSASSVREDAATEALPDSAAAPPPRADSCFGRCGFPALLALPADCACDVGCLMRGDCCADKHELCAVSDAAPVCSLTGPDVDRPLCGTDLGWSFTHDGALEIFFGDSYTAQCTVPFPSDDSQGRLPLVRPAVIPDTPPSEPVACGSLIDLDTTGTGALETFAPMRLFENGNELSGSLLETPLTGFSDGTRVYTLSRRGSDFGPLYVARRDPTVAPSVKPGRNVYRVIQRFATTHFQNPTATAVARFDPGKPFERSDQTGTKGLFLWGRNDFAGDSARALYLAYQSLPIESDDGRSLWAPQFFAGLVSGVPSWVSDEKKAVPVIDGDFAQVGQHEVSFVPALNKWIMLYGGDVSETLDPAQNDQPRHGAIHVRMADAPWGPFTRAAPAFWREHAAHFMHCDAPKDPPPGVPAGCDLDQLPDDPAHSYSPGTWAPQLLDFTGCRTDSPVPQSPADDPETGLLCTGTQRGTLYGPNLLEPWTVDRAGDQGYAHAATLYFNVSTWVPYQVILAALTVHLP